MKISFTFSHLVLFMVAAIWGSGFVAQRYGMESLGPYSFNALRFVLATLVLTILWWWVKRTQSMPTKRESEWRYLLGGGFLAGTVMCLGFSFQQVGLQYTTAGNAGFITSMYIVLVPLLGMLLGQAAGLKVWLGIAVAVLGLYYLSVGEGFTMRRGDVIELMGAGFWAVHVLLLGILSQRMHDAIGIAVVQFATAAMWAIGLMCWLETPHWVDVQTAWWPLLYSSVVVSGIGFTLQIWGQRTIDSSTAALILSLEAVFALLSGWLFLNEHVGVRELFGAGLMLLGMLISQWPERRLKQEALCTP